MDTGPAEPTQTRGLCCLLQRHPSSRDLKRRLISAVSVIKPPGNIWADLGDGRVEDVADVSRRGFVPLPQGQRVGIQPPLDSSGLGPGQGGQQHGFVRILAVLADEVGQPGVGQPLLLLLAL